LKGLEVSIIPFSSLDLADRFDAEYFSKENRAIEKSLKDHDAWPLREFGTLVGSAFYPAATDLYERGDIPFARCVDCIDHPVITRQQDTEFVRVPAWFVDQSKQIDCVRDGDIIITKVGTPCFASIVHEYDRIALSRTVLGLVRIHDLDPFYLTAFLRCRFGFNQLLRQREQTIQFQLTLERVRNVLIYRASSRVQSAVRSTILSYVAAVRQSHLKMEEAEAIIARALGLATWSPPNPLAYTRPASQVLAARRLDSQYFAPRVVELLSHLGSDGQCVRDVAPARRERFTPSDSGTFRYMEISDVRSDGSVTASVVPTRGAPSRATWYVRQGDVVTSTVRPNRRLSALVAPDQDGSVASSGFVVLQPQTMPAEVVLTYLRLPVFCELMDLHTSASLYPAISDGDLLDLPFPKIKPAASNAIASAVRLARAEREHAHYLLTRATRGVEIAIEDSESAALKYMEEN